MRPIRDLPIKNKIVLIIVLTTGIMLLFSGSIFFVYEMVTYRQTTVERLMSMAQITGTNSTGALLFNDKKLAENTIAALEAEPDILAAALYSANEILFVKYILNGHSEVIPERVQSPGIIYESTKLIIIQPVILDDEKIGYIYIVFGLERFYNKLWVYGALITLVVFILLGVTFILSNRLQRIISTPILEMAELAKNISEKKDYSYRAKKSNNDELGLLTDGINEMLAGIQSRDEELHKLNRMLMMLSKSDEILIRAKDEQSFLQDVCKIIVEIGNYHTVWVGYAENDEEKTIQPVASAGYIGEYFQTCRISWSDDEFGGDPAGTSVRMKQTIIIDDIGSNQHFRFWCKEVNKYNYKSSIAIPLITDDQTLGVINIYSNYSNAFQKEEVNLLTELANDLAYGLRTMRTREEHKKSEDALIESEKHFRLLVDYAPVAMVVDSGIGDPEKVIMINKKFTDLFGYIIDDIPSIEIWWTLAYPDEIYRQKIKNIWIESLEKSSKETAIMRPLEAKVTCKDGLVRDIEFHQATIGDKHLITFIDLTGHKQAELQLVQAQKMETIGTLAGGIAHDFNNILGGIIGTLSLLQHKRRKNKLTEADLDKYINTMEKAGQDAADVVNQLLTLSRKKEIALKPFDLNILIKDVTKICENSFDKSIEIISHFYEKESLAMADPIQMEHVLLNLCVNASHAMTIMKKESEVWGGKLSVSIKMIIPDKFFLASHKAAEEITYWVIAISDTGVGIDPAVKLKIFDPFFTTEKKGKGTGLGLTMVYNIVKQHRGFIEIYSEIGIGSTFDVYIPVYAGEPEKPIEETEEKLFTGSGLILVIDDEEMMRTIAKGILEECGYNVILATDGIEGINIFQQMPDKINGIVLDLVMPRKSGKETFIELKAIKRDVKVLLASGFKQDERVRDMMELGVIDFMQKPYTINELSKKIYEVLKYGSSSLDS